MLHLFFIVVFFVEGIEYLYAEGLPMGMIHVGSWIACSSTGAYMGLCFFLFSCTVVSEFESSNY